MKPFALALILQTLLSANIAHSEDSGMWWTKPADKPSENKPEEKPAPAKKKSSKSSASKTTRKKQTASEEQKLEPPKMLTPVITEKASVSAKSLVLPEVKKDSPTGMLGEERKNLVSIILKTEKQCLVAEYATLPNGELSCTEATPMRYTKRDCASSSVLEIGETEGQVSCHKKRLELRFRTSTDAIHVTLRLNRQSEGRSGTSPTYLLETSSEEESSITKLLPEPKLLELTGRTPEESPLTLKFSGFATLEWEKTRNFGFDTISGQANFDAKAQQAKQSNLNFFTNFGFEASRDRSSLVSLFEIGEIYYGDTTSGGGQGARANNIFEVRNLYISHGFSDNLGFKGGIVTTASDPRSFVFNDQIASVQATYKSDLSEGLIWYGEGAKNRPAAAHKRDQYAGISGTLGFLTGMKATVFEIERSKDSDTFISNDGANATLTGDSRYHWLGATLDFDVLPSLALQSTAIANWGKTKFADGIDSFHGSLLDLRLTQSWGISSLVTTLEGIATSGAKGSIDPSTKQQIRGKRANFISPIGSAYLLSIATSDGADDSPGTPKESIIANLNQGEGLRILVASVNANFTRKTSAFGRFGYLQAGKGSLSTGKNQLGREGDLGISHQLTPSTVLQLDFAVFMPGDFFDSRASASLAAAKMKFSF